MDNDGRYLLKLPADLKRRAEIDARARGVSLAKYIRDALEFVLALGKRKGYIQCAGGSPAQATIGRVEGTNGPVLPDPPPSLDGTE